MCNDDNAAWLRTTFNQIQRVSKNSGIALSFYSWNRVDLFMATWKAAEFRPVGHIIFRKSYASSTRFVRYISVEPTSGYGGEAECRLSGMKI